MRDVALLLAVAWPVAGYAQAPGGLSIPGGESSSGSSSPFQLSQQQTADASYKGSVSEEKPTSGTLQLSLDRAIQMGLQHNLGLVLNSTNQTAAGGQKLEQLQSLLPTVNGKITEAVQQTDLQAEGLRIPGFPAIIGPYGYTDIRATLNWTLVNVASLQNYLASKHNFQSARLSLQDARDEVVLTVGNAYLTVIADEGLVAAAQAQLDTSRISLDQAVQNHRAGTAPLIDELRAKVDYQTQQQALIASKNAYEKDKLALARAIGLPLAQDFVLSDQAPYVQLDSVDPETAVKEAIDNRYDYKAMQERLLAAEKARKAATAERYPTLAFEGDYGDIGVNVLHSHGTGDAVGTLTVPILNEGKFRGDATQAQSQLEQERARLSDLRGQISADVRDSILDIQSAQKQVQVARNNVDLAKEELSEAQQRYAAGVADNLAVSQAQQSLAQADNQYVNSLYQHNIAKLSLARALGVAEKNYKAYVGGK
ncbi:TolC family protein [Acidipila rosea]|uniref:Outer membrane protein TolC n=1 Tax=Acidipila rosea TaxID=768535 RepID=A0A4R1L7U2_9BACT|nr:TolC family protein [Acidipila rosea]TCK74292.1 outer membrane protein TolC [Acidipila rosea]